MLNPPKAKGKKLKIMYKQLQKIRKTTLAVLLSAIAVISVNAQQVGDKFKSGKLYYEITKLYPGEVKVTFQRRSSPYYDNTERPKGAIGIPKTANAYKVTGIGDHAFIMCYELTSVIIPESVTFISKDAFVGTGLTTIDIPKSVISISSSAFYRIKSLTEIKVASDNPNYSAQNGVLFNKEQTELIAYPGGKTDTEYTIPSSVTEVGLNAFYNSKLKTITITPNTVKTIGRSAFFYSSLTNITIPNGVTSIEKNCFSNCRNLETVTISKTVTSINHPFAYNDMLQSITVATENPNYCSVDGVLFDKEQKKLLKYPENKTNTEYAIPNSVTSIEKSALSNSTNLTSITIPNSVKAINSWGVNGCKNLTTIISQIEDVKSVKMGYGVFGKIRTDKCTLYVPKGKVDEYRDADQWKDFANIEEDPNSTTGITTLISDNNLSIVGKNITISKVADKEVKLYSVTGQVLYNLHATQDNITLSVKQAGTYILQVENATRKIVVN